MKTTIDVIEDFIHSDLDTDNYSSILDIDINKFNKLGDRLYEHFMRNTNKIEDVRKLSRDDELSAFSLMHGECYYSSDTNTRTYYNARIDITNALQLLIFTEYVLKIH